LGVGANRLVQPIFSAPREKNCRRHVEELRRRRAVRDHLNVDSRFVHFLDGQRTEVVQALAQRGIPRLAAPEGFRNFGVPVVLFERNHKRSVFGCHGWDVLQERTIGAATLAAARWIVACYCRSIFFSSTIRFHFAISRSMRPRISSGVEGLGTPPSSASRRRTSGSSTIARTSRLSRSMIGFGVPGELASPSHELPSTPGSVSAIVGTSGISG